MTATSPTTNPPTSRYALSENTSVNTLSTAIASGRRVPATSRRMHPPLRSYVSFLILDPLPKWLRDESALTQFRVPHAAVFFPTFRIVLAWDTRYPSLRIYFACGHNRAYLWLLFFGFVNHEILIALMCMSSFRVFKPPVFSYCSKFSMSFWNSPNSTVPENHDKSPS